MFTVLGIPNCDTVKKARKYLAANSVPHQFRDIRKEPLSAEEWRGLADQDRDEKLINTRSPTFRKSGVDKADLNPETKTALLVDHPTAMKRPVVLEGQTIKSIGFNEAQYNQTFGIDA